VSQVQNAPLDYRILFHLINRGFRLFPVAPKGKKPLISDWPRKASRDPKQIEMWMRSWQGSNWATATGRRSDIFVLDIDGDLGRKALAELVDRHGHEWIDTFAVKTGNGTHFYFRWPSDGEGIRNSAGRLALGIDVRGEGGYAIVPPSVHSSGEVYACNNTNAVILGAPPWLLEALAIQVPANSSTRAQGVDLVILQGRRNATLTSLAGTMRKGGMTAQAIEAALMAKNAARCKPPLMEDEVRRIVKSVARYEPPSSEGEDRKFADDSLALRFTERHAADLRYTAVWSQWSHWDGTRWKPDETLHVFDLARKICRSASSECGDKRVSRVASAAAVAAVERLARADRRHAADVDQWDNNDWLLNTPTGTVDLRTGSLQPHRREDNCTKRSAIGPSGECPRWLEFLERITDRDTALQGFLKRTVGYCLTGTTREECLFFLYGTGANGKSVFLSTVMSMLGEYAKAAPMQIFVTSSGDQHPTDLAGLQGARFVSAIETEEGRNWAESRIKALTGQDRISARFMHGNFFEYSPKFKLLFAGNHKPSLRSVTESIKRRFHLVPFTVTIPEAERDCQLLSKLQAELPGILKWAIDGCREWQREGLAVPARVRETTADYLAEEDALGRWLDERCVISSKLQSPSAVLFRDWKEWCELSEEYVGSQKRFSQMLDGRRFQRVRIGADRNRGFQGLTLRRVFEEIAMRDTSTR
jgi:P4 family phage/plasmid primase-like protien